MKFLLNFIMVNVALTSIVSAYAIDMEKGDSRVGGNFSDSETAVELIKAGAIGMDGYLKVPDDNFYYVLMDGYLGRIRLNPSASLGGWPLSRWKGEYVEQELLDTYQYGMEWSEILSEPNDLMGCMLHAPLRYGDLTRDGKGELVVLLPSEYSVDWSIFSTSLNKIIFSSKLDYNNSIPQSEVPDYLTPDLQGNEYQYWLRTGVESDRPGQMGPALRAYGKLYLRDFNEDGVQDIILWRKLYQSRAKDDQVQGFRLVRQKLLHYQLKDGEYQQADTEESLIQGWLQKAGLTWQNGYPKNSECPGEEGELIQEMHDPLLNDPDVLK